MTNIRNIITILLAIVLAFTFVGCDSDEQIDKYAPEFVKRNLPTFIYEKDGAYYTITDIHDNTIVFSKEQTVELSRLTEDEAANQILNKFHTEYPADYISDGVKAKVLRPDTIGLDREVIEDESVEVPTSSKQTKSFNFDVVDDKKSGFNPLIQFSILLNIVLVAVVYFYHRSLKKAKLALSTFAKKVDLFRDKLDQTPQGDVIDEVLLETFKGEASDDPSILKEVAESIRSEETPTKVGIPLDVK